MGNPLAAVPLESSGEDSESTKRPASVPADVVADEIRRLGLKKFVIERVPCFFGTGEDRKVLSTVRRRRLIVNKHMCAVIKVSTARAPKGRDRGGCVVTFSSNTVAGTDFVIVWLAVSDHPKNFFIIPTPVLTSMIPAILSGSGSAQVKFQPTRPLKTVPRRLLDIWAFEGRWMLLM